MAAKEQILIHRCPDCGSHKVQKRGIDKNGERRFTCLRCGRHYSPKSKPKERGPIKFLCPYCGSKKLYRRGFARSGARKYSCCDCGRNFTPEGGRVDRKIRDIVEKLVERGLKPKEIMGIVGCSYYLPWSLLKKRAKSDSVSNGVK